jgi:tetratricopeptide (TPR) repeat protein
VLGAAAVARVNAERALAEDSLAPDGLAWLRSALDVDYVVAGTYLSLGAAGRVRIDLRLVDARSGDTVALVGDSGTEAELADMVARAGTRLRDRLARAELTPEQASAVRATLPQSPVAARFYTEGLTKMRTLECSAARLLFEDAVKIEPDYPLAHAALADALWFLGHGTEARAQAKQALDLAERLPRPERLLIEGRYWETAGEPAKAVEIYGRLFHEQPDNAEPGFALAHAAWRAGDMDALRAAQTALRALPQAAADPRLDVGEANISIADGDWARALEVAGRLVASGVLPLRREDPGPDVGARDRRARARALRAGGPGARAGAARPGAARRPRERQPRRERLHPRVGRRGARRGRRARRGPPRRR